MTIADINLVVAIVASVIAMVVAWRKSGIDTRKTNAEAADIYQEIAAESAKEIRETREHLRKLETRVEELEKLVENMMDEKRDDEQYITDLSCYIDKLIEIMKAAGLNPPPRPTRKTKPIQKAAP